MLTYAGDNNNCGRHNWKVSDLTSEFARLFWIAIAKCKGEWK